VSASVAAAAAAPAEALRSVKLIGLGGTGGIAARYLVAWAAARGEPARIVLVDGDDFEPRNAERMLFSRPGNKAAVVRADLLPYAAGSLVTLDAVEEYLRPDNLARLVREGDVVLLAVDNHATRKLVAGHCATLADVTLVSAGNDGVGPDSAGRVLRGTYGNVQLHLRRAGRDVTPNLCAHHPEIAAPADRLPSELSCTEALASTPQLLFTNLAAASLLLNTLLLALGERPPYAEACFDTRAALMRPVL
jgi:hypothetical protein